jgi:hypothetical protein
VYISIYVVRVKVSCGRRPIESSYAAHNCSLCAKGRRQPRLKLKEWAESEGVSVNAIVVSVLEAFFECLKKSRVLREELRRELRMHRGFMPI